MKLPSVEVRYKNLNVEAECEVVQGKPLPTLWNSFSSLFSVSMLLEPTMQKAVYMLGILELKKIKSKEIFASLLVHEKMA